MIPIRDSASGASFAVRVHPRAKKTAITGILGEGVGTTLKVALAAPPVDGRANETLIEYFSDFFGVPRTAVSIISGAQSRTKVLRVAGVSAAQLARRLAPCVDTL
jgi:uncharacterized protein (TIGR00251 family)